MRASIKWLPTTLDPHKMIAEPTLNALRALLNGSAGRRTSAGSVAVRLQDHPILSEVGGVARVDAIGVARISSSSYVAYVGDEAGALQEVPVVVDAASGVLRIEPPAVSA